MGLNCLLISTNRVIIPYPVYPLGVAHLMGALQASGHRVSHYDILAQGGLAGLSKRIKDFQPDLVGLSIRNLDTVDSTAPDAFVDQAREIMDFVKANQEAPVVLGGPAFSIMPEAMLDLLGADYGVVGEGELLLPWLADELAAGRRPQEKILRSAPSGNCWRSTVYDPATVGYYLGNGGMLNVQTKRGCPYRCSYCSYPTLEGRTYRFRDPAEVAAEVIRLTREHGARYIFFTDSVFNDVQGHYLEVAEALIRAGNTTPWCAFFRPQRLTAEAFRLMKRAGLAAMEVGTDAASDTTLKGLHKEFTFAEVKEINDLAGELDIPCAHFIIFGGPDEDAITLAEGLANVEQLTNSVVFAFSGIRVLPGTAMFERAVEDGVMSREQSLLAPFFYFSPKISEEELDRTLRNAWTTRFDRIYPASRMQDRITSLHQRGHIGPLWDMLIRRRR